MQRRSKDRPPVFHRGPVPVSAGGGNDRIVSSLAGWRFMVPSRPSFLPWRQPWFAAAQRQTTVGALVGWGEILRTLNLPWQRLGLAPAGRCAGTDPGRRFAPPALPGRSCSEREARRILRRGIWSMREFSSRSSGGNNVYCMQCSAMACIVACIVLSCWCSCGRTMKSIIWVCSLVSL